MQDIIVSHFILYNLFIFVLIDTKSLGLTFKLSYVRNRHKEVLVYIYIFSFLSPEPEIPDIQQEEEAAEGEATEQGQGETAGGTTEDAEPQEQALGVSTPTGEDESPRKGTVHFRSDET